MPWTVYLARCRDGTLYTGITTDPERRLAEHNAGSGAAYTRTRLPIAFVYWEAVADRSSALRREHAIKELSRAGKEALAASGDRIQHFPDFERQALGGEGLLQK
jgi:predicted GIY-YIG superfamily endonuclease